MVLPPLDPTTLIPAAGYVGLFFIVAAESGLFFGFFFPGDSLLFTAGLLAATGTLDIWTLVVLMPVAAVIGDSIGYWLGAWIGPRIFVKEDSFFFSTQYVTRAEYFYKRHGAKAVVLARFVPIVRTFVPILAGVGSMRYRTFVTYNVVGGLLWGVGVTLLGYFLGKSFPDTVHYLLPIIVVVIVLSLLPILREWRRTRRQGR